MKKIVACLVLITTLTGCVEEYDLNIAEMPPRIVVDGFISNEAEPYYIRLTESHNGKIYPSDNYWKDNLKAVKDALVIISDNVNQIDTLVLIDNLEDYEYDWNLYMYYKPVYDDFGNAVDTIWWSDPVDFSFDKGYYKTTTLVGIPGRTYSLKIIYKGEEYRAEAYMPPVPDIDSVGYIMQELKPGVKNYFPTVYFSEPQETKDYYLIQQRYGEYWANDMTTFLYTSSILSDEFLKPYIDGLAIGTLGWYGHSDTIMYYVRLSSLTKEGYLFYKAIMQQYESDGGTFQPAPASPPTNISNGGLGFFRASAVSEKSGIMMPLVD